MGIITSNSTRFGVLLYLPLFLILFLSISHSYLTANPSTSWTNSVSNPNSMTFLSGATVRIILPNEFNGPDGPVFACGFICNQTCHSSYLFAIFVLHYSYSGKYFDDDDVDPQVVWTANQNNPVKIGAKLQLTSTGGLALLDANGSIAWSTNIGSKAVAGLNLTDEGNLVLLDENNDTIWQSFDHPTDTLLLGQILMVGQKLTSVDEGLFSFSVTSKGLLASLESNPPQDYFTRYISIDEGNPSEVEYTNGRLGLFSTILLMSFSIPEASSIQYIRLGADGHLRVYQWYDQEELKWKEEADLLTGDLGDCGYPTICGNYGICTYGQCRCPPTSIDGTSYFKPIDDRRPDFGCSAITPLSCETSQNHTFLELKNVSNFDSNLNSHFYLKNLSLESCKKACLMNCSCSSLIYSPSFYLGDCYIQSQTFSLKAVGNSNVTYTTYIRVQNVTKIGIQGAVPRTKKTIRVAVILGSSFASLFGLFLFVSVLVLLFRKNRDADEAEEEYYLDQVPGMPKRYSYKDLKAVTENFKTKLGRGGFGSVFEGTLIDGTKIAVKCLDGFGQIKKSFLAKVETIGNLHHFNLVRLVGFCAEKSHRLLVYEYMCNGSLDKWIFYKTTNDQFMVLDWYQRKKIIADTAKGLAYLHEDCRQKIVHLDVKPGNILLDENFNAKVSDFGLSKLIDRDQSQVVTTMRGTPGYLAPEWLNSVITEKVDVYSFGVMTLEILCGRRIFDSSQPEEAMYLLNLYKIKAEEGQLLDLVDKHIGNIKIQLHGEEILTMMKVVAWCLQFDFAKRPSMSVVVKVLEGIVDVEDNLDYNFSNRPLLNTRARVIHQEVNLVASTPPLPSVLSAAR